ncbi:tetrapeptide repeat homeobox protein 2 [Phacochoerus africanus]|uniref:tetrapeptide repeat homeobox protein 2 n=1 Tax=Phacochoerus africanus TaxID=41426 RepID=UPI001FD8D4A8|nr:tetrapeptide repeat homeobox protein 2 [Phacochoerus africanus]
MEEPGKIHRRGTGATSRSGHPKRQRQERTVYTKVQLEMLEKFFKKNEFPGYQDRLRLAASLRLEEHKVQVWFKNRRAKRSRLERLAKGQGQGTPDAPTDPGGCRRRLRRCRRPRVPRGPGFLAPPSAQPRGDAPCPGAQRLQRRPGPVGPGPRRPGGDSFADGEDLASRQLLNLSVIVAAKSCRPRGVGPRGAHVDAGSG